MGGQTHLLEPPGTFPLSVITALGLLTISTLSPTPETLMQVVTRGLRQWYDKPKGCDKSKEALATAWLCSACHMGHGP